MRRVSLSPPFSLTQGLQHFLPVHHEILKPGPTVSHGDLLQEVDHSSVILPLFFHPFCLQGDPLSSVHSPNHSGGSLVHSSKRPGSTDVSVILTATCRPGLQGERVYPHHGKERAQPSGLTDSLPQLDPPPLAQPMWPCALLKGHSLLDY